MNWQDFNMGGMTVMIFYALFSNTREEEELDPEEENTSSIVVNDLSGRYVTLSCQTCRKLKRHKEVQPNLFQCIKCKRHVDLRVS